MLYKNIDSKELEINQLKNLLKQSKNPKQQALIRADLARIENGYKAEKDNAYYLDFSFKDSPNHILLHDIRIEHNGQVAQIDHILISRLRIEVLESKSFKGILTIKGDGSLNVEYGKKVQTFPNPIEQNNRHEKIISEFLKENMELPSNLKLLGIAVNSTVLINPKTTVTNDTLPDGFTRADSFKTYRNEGIDKMSVLNVFKGMGTAMNIDKAKEIADFLVKHHKPKSYDYAKKYPNRKEEEVTQKKEKPTENELKKESKTLLCSKCQSENIEICYGRYGYYFKCLKCDGNTAIKLTCSTSDCKPKLKKSKLNFYQVCDVCGMNELFFTNKETKEIV